MGSYLFIDISNRTFAIELEKVDEVLKVENFSIIPGSPNYVRGFLNLRGTIVTMIEMDSLIEKEESNKEFNHLVVLHTRDSEEDKVAIVAHRIMDVYNLDSEHIQEVPEAEDESFKKFVEKMYVDDQKSAYIIDINNVMDLKEE